MAVVDFGRTFTTVHRLLRQLARQFFLRHTYWAHLDRLVPSHSIEALAIRSVSLVVASSLVVTLTGCGRAAEHLGPVLGILNLLEDLVTVFLALLGSVATRGVACAVGDEGDILGLARASRLHGFLGFSCLLQLGALRFAHGVGRVVVQARRRNLLLFVNLGHHSLVDRSFIDLHAALRSAPRRRLAYRQIHLHFVFFFVENGAAV